MKEKRIPIPIKVEEYFFQHVNHLEDRYEAEVYGTLLKPLSQRVLHPIFAQYLPPEGSILEIGAGTGRLTRLYLPAQYRPQLLHVDINRHAVALHKELLPEQRIRQASAYDLPFKSESQRAFIALSSFDSLGHLDAAVSEAHRVVADGSFGIVVQDMIAEQYGNLIFGTREYTRHLRKAMEKKFRIVHDQGHITADLVSPSYIRSFSIPDTYKYDPKETLALMYLVGYVLFKSRPNNESQVRDEMLSALHMLYHNNPDEYQRLAGFFDAHADFVLHVHSQHVTIVQKV